MMPSRYDPRAPRRRILVTGGGGFIGAHLVRRCVQEGDEVHVLLRPATDPQRLAGLQGAIVAHRLCLADRAALRACLDEARPDEIFHLATGTTRRQESGIAPVAASLSDLTDLMSLIEEVARSPHPPQVFVRAGSIAEYGEVPPPFREDQREHPATAYAAGVVAGTQYLGALAPNLPYRVTTARLALVYGVGQARDFLVPGLIAASLSGEPFTMARPLDRRDLVHVDDVVDALLRLARTEMQSGEIVNIGSGQTIGVAELAEMIAALAGSDTGMIRRMEQERAVTLQLDIAHMRAITAWAPTIALPHGLMALIEETRRARVAEAA